MLLAKPREVSVARFEGCLSCLVVVAEVLRLTREVPVFEKPEGLLRGMLMQLWKLLS